MAQASGITQISIQEGSSYLPSCNPVAIALWVFDLICAMHLNLRDGQLFLLGEQPLMHQPQTSEPKERW
jgi:hypothetical protein